MNKNDKIALIVLSAVYLPIFLFHLYYYLRNINAPKVNLKKVFKYNFLILLSLAIVVLILSHTNYLDYEKPIPYNKINQITFKNFRGLELFKKELNGSKYFAYVVTTIELEKNDNSVEITSFFYPSRSFVYNKNTAGNELFDHELFHFKITEVFARKARKEISEKKNISFDEIKKIVEQARINENEFQKKYDYDTYHSYVLSQQKKYQKEIDSLLHLMTNYSETKINLDEKK
ncbi:MAG: hypothetical protein ABIQ27_02230 [Flavobacterium sp.]|uniref:hypothetical protein n=1 Tax=Flavobacterium sp. TaxID=239 RepID=UPI003264F98B